MSPAIMMMSMVLVFVTVITLAFPYPQNSPILDDEVPLVLDDASPQLTEGGETVDARHHYNSNQRPAVAYNNRPAYNRPSYSQPAYNRPASYNNRPQNYGSAGHYTAGGYNSGYGGHSSNYYGGSNSHGSFGGLGWREAQKSGQGDAAPSDEMPLVRGDAETGASEVVFQQ